MKTKTRRGPKRERSATAPIARIGLDSEFEYKHDYEKQISHIRDGREHELVHAENNRRNACAADGGLFEYAFQTEIFCESYEHRTSRIAR
jgi:hypothetical protein